MQHKWIRVTHKNKCPCCGHPDWCGVSEDGSVAICMRVKSDKGTKNDGWLHILKEQPKQQRTVVRKIETPPSEPVRQNPDFTSMVAEWQSDTGKEEMDGLASTLGVSADALLRIGACFAGKYGAWAFPMKDGQNNIIGIRLRATDGRKWAVKGSQAGIFYGQSCNPDYVLICEGPTDTAAGITAGFYAIGRPSCRGQEKYVVQLLKPLWNSRLAIVADHDGPGIEGARKLAMELKRPVRIIIPPAKDIREWVRSGAGRCEITAACDNAAVLNLR